MLDGLVIAAGFSSRAGPRHKLLAAPGGIPVITRTVLSLLPHCDRVLVVTGHRADDVSAAISGLPRVEIVPNSAHRDGMLSSLRAGLRRVEADRCLFLPGDCPFVASAVLAAMRDRTDDILVPRHGGRPGHPVLLGPRAIRDLLDDPAPIPLRDFIAARGCAFLDVDDPGVLRDVDTPEDLAALDAAFAEPIPEALAEARDDGLSRSVRRTDAAAKADGTAAYCADLAPEGLLRARTLRSTQACARLLGVAVPPLPEGYAVVDAGDIPGRNRMPDAFDDWPFLAEDRVDHIGQPILLLVGPDPQVLEDLLRRTEVRYAPEVPVLTPDASSVRFAEQAFERGDVDAAAAVAVLSVEDEVATGPQEHAYLEPQAMLAAWGPDGVVVQGSMQCPYYVVEALSAALGLPPDRCRVVQLPTGGGFGGKEEYPSLPAVHASLAARKTGRPVRIVFERQEDMVSTTKRHPATIRLRSHLDASGRISALEVDARLDGGAYGGLSAYVLERLCLSAGGVYGIPNLRVRGAAYRTNRVPSGAFRGFGGPQAFFALERHMEHVAEVVGADSFAFRAAHFAREGTPTATGAPYRTPVPLVGMARRIAEASDYDRKRRAYGIGSGRGIGASFFFHGCGLPGRDEAAPAHEGVRLRRLPDGCVEILASCAELGQGSSTTLRKVAAAALGIPLDRILHAYPDTARVPDSGPTVASRTAMVVGQLVQEAAVAMKALWEEPGDLEVARRFAYPADRAWDPATRTGDAYLDYAWGANVVEVAVDPATCAVEVVGAWALYDIGRPLDLRIVRGQAEGGLAQSLGYAGMEVLSDAAGRLLQDTLTTYAIPTSEDLPRPWIRFVDDPTGAGPQGARGLGELTMVGGAPAFASAVRQATGVAVDALPVTPEALLAAGFGARKASGSGGAG